MGVRLPPFAPGFISNSLRLIFHQIYFPAGSFLLRLGCRLLWGYLGVQLIDETNISPRNQMHMLVGRDPDGTVPHLVTNVRQRWWASGCSSLFTH